MTSAKRQREHEAARRAALREMRRREAGAFFCKGPHPNASQAAAGRKCSFALYPHVTRKDSLCACHRCGQVHVFNGMEWIPLDITSQAIDISPNP